MKDYSFLSIRNFWIFLIALTVLTRVVKISQLHIWYDEAVSINIAAGYSSGEFSQAFTNEDYFSSAEFWKKNTFQNTYKASILDNGNSIVYNTILYGFIKATGFSIPLARVPSIIFGILCVFMVYFLSELLFGIRNISMLASLFAAIDPTLIAYSYEIRSYSAAIFFSLLSTYLLFYILKNKNRNILYFILYGLLVTTTFFTHFLSSYIFAIHGLIIMLYFYTDRTFEYLKFGISLSIFILFFSVWHQYGNGEKAFEIMSMQNHKWVEKIELQKNAHPLPFSFNELAETVQRNVLIIFRIPAPYYKSLTLYLPLLLLFPIAYIILFIKGSSQLKRPLVISIGILAISSIVYASTMYILTHHTVAFWLKYTVFALPYISILLAVSFSYLSTIHSNILRAFIIGSFVLFQGIFLYTTYNSNQEYTYKADALANSILIEKQPNDTLIFPAWKIACRTNLHLKNQNDIIQHIDTLNKTSEVYLVNGKRKKSLGSYTH